MNLWREMGTHTDGSPWTDLWWRPSESDSAPRTRGRQ
jgi:hypothetical protein